MGSQQERQQSIRNWNNRRWLEEHVLTDGAPWMIGPFTVTWDDGGFLNPDDNGIPTLDIPAGTVVDGFAVVTEAFTVVPGDELILGLASGPGGSMIGLADYDIGISEPGDPLVGHREPRPKNSGYPDYFVKAQLAGPSRGLAVVDCNIYAALYTDANIGSGSVDIYALIYTSIE